MRGSQQCKLQHTRRKSTLAPFSFGDGPGSFKVCSWLGEVIAVESLEDSPCKQSQIPPPTPYIPHGIVCKLVGV